MLSILNCTLVTLTLSDALALRPTVPDTVEALAGAVSETVGGAVSAATLLTVTDTEAVARLPAASLATALTVWLPLASVVVSQLAV